MPRVFGGGGRASAEGEGHSHPAPRRQGRRRANLADGAELAGTPERDERTGSPAARRRDAGASSGHRGGTPDEGPRQPAFDFLVKLASQRDHSTAEYRTKLARKGYGEADVEEALRRGLACGIVDDARYADALIRSRVASGKGVRSIERDLERQGIDPAILHERESEFGADAASQAQAAYELLCQHPPRSKDPRAAAYRRLMARGFTSEAAWSAIRRWNPEAIQ